MLISSATFLPVGTKVATIVIDPGHGGRDPGNLGKRSKEKDIALKISLRFGELIEKNHPDVKVIFTRKDDRYVDLDERAVLANKVKADLFVCIHCNSEGGNTAYGTETFVMGLSKDQRNFDVAKRENSVMLMDENQERYEGFDPESPESYILFTLNQSAFQESSLRLAQKMESQFKKKVGRYSRGVKQAGFWVLWRTAMPSILVETGFLSNAKEEAFLMSEQGQEQMAMAIYQAFHDYKTEIEYVHPKEKQPQ